MNVAERFFIKTAAYRTVAAEKKEGTLGHSYLLLCRDTALLRDYVKALAKLIMCEKGDFCGECRACRLIDRELYGDCEIYPPLGEKMTAEDVDIIVSEKCFIRPLEAERRVFAIVDAEKMNLTSQNKLLKTLEEPPANVHILLGASIDRALLPTVRSRMFKLEIPAFTPDEIYNEIQGSYEDKERLLMACELCGGMPGRADGIYRGEAAFRLTEECFAMLAKMRKSRDIAGYSAKLAKLPREDFAAFLSELSIIFRDILLVFEGKEELAVHKSRLPELIAATENFREGALITFAAYLDRAIAAFGNNANQTMLADRLLFALLEENYRWQKL